MDFEYYNEDGEMYVCISVSRLEAVEAYFAEEIINPKKWFKKFVIDNGLTQDFKNYYECFIDDFNECFDFVFPNGVTTQDFRLFVEELDLIDELFEWDENGIRDCVYDRYISLYR